LDPGQDQRNMVALLGLVRILFQVQALLGQALWQDPWDLEASHLPARLVQVQAQSHWVAQVAQTQVPQGQVARVAHIHLVQLVRVAQVAQVAQAAQAVEVAVEVVGLRASFGSYHQRHIVLEENACKCSLPA